MGNKIKAFRETVHYTWKGSILMIKTDWKKTLLVFGLSLLVAIISPLLIVISKYVIDYLTLNGDSNNIAKQILFLAILLVFLHLFKDVVRPIIDMQKNLLKARLNRRVDELLMNKANSIPDLAPFENSTFHAKTRVFQMNSYFATVWIDILVVGFSGVVTIVTVSGILWYLIPWVSLLFIMIGFPRLFIEAKLNSILYEGREEVQEIRRRSDYLIGQPLSPETGHEMKLFQLTPFFQKKYAASSEELMNLLKGDQRKWVIHRMIWGVIELLFIAFVFIFLINKSITNTVTPGDLALFFGAILQLSGGINSIYGILAIGAREALQIRNLFEFIHSSTNIEETDKSKARIMLNEIKTGFSLENIKFSYDGKREILNIKSLKIPKNKITALVGENGAGKSTLVHLLCRFYDPNEGVIKLNDKSLADYDINSLRNKYTAIFQDFIKYELTLQQNIGVGNLNDLEDMEKILNATEDAKLTDIIKKMELGFDTQLGRLFDGIDLSGGQWQRVALARAFMRDKADIVILDEPTASIDAKTEYELFRLLKKLSENKTVILISHRFSTVNMADNIVFLEKGSVLEQGNHQTLMSKKGKYAELYQMQSEAYS